VDFSLASATLVAAGAVRVKNTAAIKIYDTDFCLRVDGSHCANDEVFPGSNSENWRGFGEPVTLKDRDADEIKEFVHMRLQGSAAGNCSAEISTSDGLTKLGEDDLVQDAIGKIEGDPAQKMRKASHNSLELPAPAGVELLPKEEAFRPLDVAGAEARGAKERAP
jgi:hypothetical protein